MQHSTILHNVSSEQIHSLFNGLQQQISDLKQNLEPKKPKEYLTRSETAELLKVDLSTLHNWSKKGKLNPYGIGNRVYYLRTEIESVLLPIGKMKDGRNE